MAMAVVTRRKNDKSEESLGLRLVLEKVCSRSSVNLRLILALLERIPDLENEKGTVLSKRISLCYLKKSLECGEDIGPKFIPLLEELLPLHSSTTTAGKDKIEALLLEVRVEVALSKLRTNGPRSEEDWSAFNQAVNEMFPGGSDNKRSVSTKRNELLKLAKFSLQAEDKDKAADAALASSEPTKRLIKEITNVMKMVEAKLPPPALDKVQDDVANGNYSLKGEDGFPSLRVEIENCPLETNGGHSGSPRGTGFKGRTVQPHSEDKVMSLEQEAMEAQVTVKGKAMVGDRPDEEEEGCWPGLSKRDDVVVKESAAARGRGGQGKGGHAPAADKPSRGGGSSGRGGGGNRGTQEDGGGADEMGEGEKRGEGGDTEKLADDDQSKCRVCHEGGKMLDCDDCRLLFHWDCVALARAPRGEWFCDACQGKKDKGKEGLSAKPLAADGQRTRKKVGVVINDSQEPALKTRSGLRSGNVPAEPEGTIPPLMQQRETRSAGRSKHVVETRGETRRNGSCRTQKDVNYADGTEEAEEEEEEEPQGLTRRSMRVDKKSGSERAKTGPPSAEGGEGSEGAAGGSGKDVTKVELDGTVFDAVDGHIEVCFECLRPGELICCDWCPAALHFECANLKRGVRLPGYTCKREVCQEKSKKRPRAVSSEDVGKELPMPRGRKAKSVPAAKAELEEESFTEHSQPTGKKKRRAETPPPVMAHTTEAGSPPGRTPSKGHRRKNLVWSKEEVDMIMDGVKKYPCKEREAMTSGAKGGRPALPDQPDWKKILEMGVHVFHPTRRDKDLYDKWRNLKKYGYPKS